MTTTESIPLSGGRSLRYYPSANQGAYVGSLRVATLSADDCAELAVPPGSLLVATLNADEDHRLVVVTPDTLAELVELSRP